MALHFQAQGQLISAFLCKKSSGFLVLPKEEDSHDFSQLFVT
jgi:hypothetical protein